MGLVLISVVVVGMLMLAMAVGVIVRGRALRGSCGGVAVRGPDGEPLTCGDCGCEIEASQSIGPSSRS